MFYIYPRHTLAIGLVCFSLLSCAPEGSPQNTNSPAVTDPFSALGDSPELRRKLLQLVRQAEKEERAERLSQDHSRLPDLSPWRKLPGLKESQVSYTMSFDLLCQPCESTPGNLEAIIKEVGARPSVRHVLRSPQGIAFALLYESILYAAPEKALPFLQWAMTAPLTKRQQPGFGKEWISINLFPSEQQQVTALIASETIQVELTRDTEWFRKTGIYDTPLLFIDGVPFRPDNKSGEDYAKQVKRFADGAR